MASGYVPDKKTDKIESESKSNLNSSQSSNGVTPCNNGQHQSMLEWGNPRGGRNSQMIPNSNNSNNDREQEIFKKISTIKKLKDTIKELEESQDEIDEDILKKLNAIKKQVNSNREFNDNYYVSCYENAKNIEQLLEEITDFNNEKNDKNS